MPAYFARRIQLQNGERLTVLQRSGGLPVHEATLYLDGLRTRGLASATLHAACMALAVFHREMDAAGIEVMLRFKQGMFLSQPELTRLATAMRYRAQEDAPPSRDGSNVISIHRVHPRRAKAQTDAPTVNAHTVASRLRYIADYLTFLSDYVIAQLPKEQAKELREAAAWGLATFKEFIPKSTNRNNLGTRVGLTEEEQKLLQAVVDPDSPDNPWESLFVRRRNQLIVLTLLATGMRKGELLGLRIADINLQTGKLLILRRPDKRDDPRLTEPNTKTREREVLIDPSIVRMLNEHINVHRHAIKRARKFPQIFVSEDGAPLSQSSVEKMFVALRSVLPELSCPLTCHVLRHTWNERFSECADDDGLDEEREQRARAEQQGWSSLSSARVYTKRHTARKGADSNVKCNTCNR